MDIVFEYKGFVDRGPCVRQHLGFGKDEDQGKCAQAHGQGASTIRSLAIRYYDGMTVHGT